MKIMPLNTYCTCPPHTYCTCQTPGKRFYAVNHLPRVRPTMRCGPCSSPSKGFDYQALITTLHASARKCARACRHAYHSALRCVFPLWRRPPGAEFQRANTITPGYSRWRVKLRGKNNEKEKRKELERHWSVWADAIADELS